MACCTRFSVCMEPVIENRRSIVLLAVKPAAPAIEQQAIGASDFSRPGGLSPTRRRQTFSRCARSRLSGLWYAVVCRRERPCPEFTSDTAQAFGLSPSLRRWRCAWPQYTQASIGTIQAAPNTPAQSACSPIRGVLRTAFRPLPWRKPPIRQPFLRSSRRFLSRGRVTPTGPERLPSPDRNII